MNLDEVRHQLTAGYERINTMKNSTARIEHCRASLRVRRESLLQEVKTMMTQMAAKLHQLQLFMETTVKDRVAHRERLLDAKKREIQEGYTGLVQVCVEADQVLRGRNDDLLGRSCQRLFNNFEAAKCKLDAAEKIDMDSILGIEFQSNSRQFLSSTYVAKLQFCDRFHRAFGAEEFWVEPPHCQVSDAGKDRKGRAERKHSDHVECRNNNRSTSGESPARSSGGSPQQPLETIDEVPEDSSGYAESKTSTPRPESGLTLDRVRVREMDLHIPDDPLVCQKGKIIFDDDIPPPPGFSKLVIADVADMDLPCAPTKSHRHRKQSPRLQPLSSPEVSSDGSSVAWTPSKSGPEGSQDDTSGCVSYPDTSPAASDQYASFASSKLSKSFPSSAQKTNIDIELLKSEVRSRDEDDFVWDSDESAEVPSPKSGNNRSMKPSSGTYQKDVKIVTDHSTQPEVRESRITASPAPYSKQGSQLATDPPPCFREPSHWDSPVDDAGKFTSQAHPAENCSHTELSHSKGIDKPISRAQEGSLSCPKSKNVALKTLEHSDASRICGTAAGGSKPSKLPVAPDINILVGQCGDKRQHLVHEKEHGSAKKEPSKSQQKRDDLEPPASLKIKYSEETLLQNIKQEVMDKDIDENVTGKEQESQACLYKAHENLTNAEVKPGIKTEPVDTKEQEKSEVAKACEVPRPITKRKRLDLSHMLVHLGGSLFEINAKCVEKIRGDFKHPIGVCTNSKGDVIVADTGNNVIKVCNNGHIINKFGGDLRMRRPSAVVVNENDEVFVKDDLCIYHFDAEGNHINTIGKKKMNCPYGLGMTRDGQLVVVDALYCNARIHIFEQSGEIESHPFHPLHNRYDDSKCRFLAVQGEMVLTSDLGKSCLYLTNLQGELLKTLGHRGKRPGELNEPAGVAVDGAGNWVVADSKNHRVQVFASNGYFMATVHVGADSIHRPSGIHLTSDGLLYVINYIESIIKVYKLGGP